MSKNYLKVVLVTVSILLLYFAGCEGDGLQPGSGGSSGSDGRRIQIESVNPYVLPSVSRDSFDVTVKGYNLYQSVYVHVEVRPHASSSCIAFSDSLPISSVNPSNTFKIRTDSISSGCVTQNSVFRVVAWFNDTLNIPRRDSVYYQWGHYSSSGNDLTINIEPWRMYYVSDILADTLNTSIVRSFNPPDSNFLKCIINFDNINHQSPDTNFLVGNGNYSGLISMCDLWSQNHSIDQFKNKIVYAKFTDVDIGQAGWSQTSNHPPNGTSNWSYIFYRNIDSLFRPSGNVNDTTYANLTAVHEILHQIANSHNDRGHLFHTGYFAYKCALWNDDSHFADVLANHRYTNRFRICIHHTMALRTLWNMVPLDDLNGNVIYTQFVAPDPFKRGAGSNSDKFSIKMSLPKQEYKKYEPVMAKIVLTNHDTKPLDIYNLHNYLSSEPHFTIRDQSGNVYNSKNISGFFISYYTTEIMSGDSLIFTMAINNWGKPTSYEKTNSLDEVYFSQFGYFPEGNYTVHFYCSPLKNEEEIYSNDVFFTVTDISHDDRDMLQLFKTERYDEALQKYPSSVFAEHVYRWKMLPYWSTITSNTEHDYNDFIQKYPKSLYLYNWGFMLPYIKAAEQRQNSFESGVDYLLSIQSQESLAKQSLSSIAFTTIIKNYGKVFEKNK